MSALGPLMQHCLPVAQHMSYRTVCSGVNMNVIWGLEERLLKIGDKNRLVLMPWRVLYLTDHWKLLSEPDSVSRGNGQVGRAQQTGSKRSQLTLMGVHVCQQ